MKRSESNRAEDVNTGEIHPWFGLGLVLVWLDLICFVLEFHPKYALSFGQKQTCSKGILCSPNTPNQPPPQRCGVSHGGGEISTLNPASLTGGGLQAPNETGLHNARRKNYSPANSFQEFVIIYLIRQTIKIRPETSRSETSKRARMRSLECRVPKSFKTPNKSL